MTIFGQTKYLSVGALALSLCINTAQAYTLILKCTGGSPGTRSMEVKVDDSTAVLQIDDGNVEEEGTLDLVVKTIHYTRDMGRQDSNFYRINSFGGFVDGDPRRWELKYRSGSTWSWTDFSGNSIDIPCSYQDGRDGYFGAMLFSTLQSRKKSKEIELVDQLRRSSVAEDPSAPDTPTTIKWRDKATGQPIADHSLTPPPSSPTTPSSTSGGVSIAPVVETKDGK